MQENIEWMVPKDASSLIYVAVLFNCGEMMHNVRSLDFSMQVKVTVQKDKPPWSVKTSMFEHLKEKDHSGVKTGRTDCLRKRWKRPSMWKWNDRILVNYPYQVPTALLFHTRQLQPDSHHQYRDSHSNSQVWWVVMRVNVRESPPSVHSRGVNEGADKHVPAQGE